MTRNINSATLPPPDRVLILVFLWALLIFAIFRSTYSASSLHSIQTFPCSHPPIKCCDFRVLWCFCSLMSSDNPGIQKSTIAPGAIAQSLWLGHQRGITCRYKEKVRDGLCINLSLNLSRNFGQERITADFGMACQYSQLRAEPCRVDSHWGWMLNPSENQL